VTKEPLLVLVHGAWHRAPMWDALIAQMPDTDIATVQLPSSAPASDSRLGDLHADARTIRALVDQADQPVVVCAHSYGGAPTTQALDGAAHVKRILYLNAFMLDVGESILSAAGGRYRPHWIVDEQAGTVRIRDAESVLYGDLDPDAARQAAASLGPQSLSSIRQPLTAAAWHHIPSTYITAARDAGVPSALSRRFSQRAGKAIVLDTAHSAFFSHPVELARVLQDELRST
jgi:pimeloyl-ACP methyl ester carboxylesterase